MRCIGLAVRRHPGDRPLLTRGPRLPRQVAVHLPRRRGQDRQQERGARGRGLDGRVEGLLLRHEPRFCGTTTLLFPGKIENSEKLAFLGKNNWGKGSKTHLLAEWIFPRTKLRSNTVWSALLLSPPAFTPIPLPPPPPMAKKQNPPPI